MIQTHKRMHKTAARRQQSSRGKGKRRRRRQQQSRPTGEAPALFCGGEPALIWSHCTVRGALSAHPLTHSSGLSCLSSSSLSLSFSFFFVPWAFVLPNSPPCTVESRALFSMSVVTAQWSPIRKSIQPKFQYIVEPVGHDCYPFTKSHQ